MDIGLSNFCHDKGYYNDVILSVIGIAMSLNFIILIIFLMLLLISDGNENTSQIKSMTHIFTAIRVLRPVYLIYRSRQLTALFLSVCKATSALGEMSIVSVLFWLTFSMMGYSLLFELDIVGNNHYFGSFTQSLWSLFVCNLLHQYI